MQPHYSRPHLRVGLALLRLRRRRWHRWPLLLAALAVTLGLVGGIPDTAAAGPAASLLRPATWAAPCAAAQRSHTSGGGAVAQTVRLASQAANTVAAPISDPASGYGSAVALSADAALVGAPQADTARGTETGAATVFARGGTSLSQPVVLVGSDNAPFDEFGAAVALSNNIAVIGAPGHDTAADDNAGAAYVFVREGTTWRQEAKLIVPNGDAPGSKFGTSLAFVGDTLLVGAPQADTPGGSSTGAVYVFVRSAAGVWSPQATLAAAQGATGDGFGWSVALSGATALVGAPFSTTKGRESGVAFVFVREGATWKQQAELRPPDDVAADQYDVAGAKFGYAIALEGNTAVVGAPFADAGGCKLAGAAYVFVLNGTAWQPQGKLTLPAGKPNDSFGWTVTVTGGTVAVGGPYVTTPGGTTGAVAVFTPSGPTWTYQTTLSPPGGSNCLFGWATAGAGGALLIGAAGQCGTPATVVPLTVRPEALDDSYSTVQDRVLTIAPPGVLGNDRSPSGAPLTAILVASPGHGTLALAANGGFSYTPEAGFVGGDRFTYKATDGTSETGVATVMLTIEQRAFPTTGVLDDFNRASRILSLWDGNVRNKEYYISAQRLNVGEGGPLYFKSNPFGPLLEAYVTLVRVDLAGAEQGLLLNVQGKGDKVDYRKGAIKVVYDVALQAIRVETIKPGQKSWLLQGRIAARLANGDQLGARTLADGRVEVFVNGRRLGVANADSFFVARRGRIGLWSSGARYAILDDFGGGTVSSTAATRVGSGCNDATARAGNAAQAAPRRGCST